MSERIPDRVNADLRRLGREERDALLDREPPPEFDETDDAIMHDTLGNERLAKPVQALLLTLRDLKAIERSFGRTSLNDRRFVETLTRQLDALRAACEAEWESMR